MSLASPFLRLITVLVRSTASTCVSTASPSLLKIRLLATTADTGIKKKATATEQHNARRTTRADVTFSNFALAPLVNHPASLKRNVSQFLRQPKWSFAPQHFHNSCSISFREIDGAGRVLCRRLQVTVNMTTVFWMSSTVPLLT